MTISVSIYVAANDKILFFVMAKQYSLVCMYMCVYVYRIFFIHLSMDI